MKTTTSFSDPRRQFALPRKFLFAALTALLVFVAVPARLAAQDTATEEQQLLATLQSSTADLHDKGMACRRLAVIGTKASVPVLAALLSDEKLSHMARYGLEPNPDPAAAQALRDAVSKLNGNLKVGAINSLGARRDTAAVSQLTTLLTDADPETASAAASALGRIASTEAARALQAALSKVAGPLKTTFGQAALGCATTRLADKNTREAQELFDALRDGDFPPPVKLGALRGAILVQGEKGISLLLAQLRSADAERFAVGLRVARELPGREASLQLGKLVTELPPPKQAQLLDALSDRGDAAVMTALLPLLKSGAVESRVAALRAVARAGDGSAAGALFDAALASEPEVVQAAQAALAALPAAADPAILAGLDSKNPKVRRAAIEAVQTRGMASAAPKLLAAARDGDAGIRRAAIKALGDSATAASLSGMLTLLNDAGEGDRSAIGEALGTACRRSADKNACADTLLAALPGAKPETKAVILAALAETGAAKALPALRTAASDANAQVKDAAIHALAGWPDAVVGPDLLGIARNAADAAQRSAAFLGLVRLGAEADAPPPVRCKLLSETMALARDPAEKKRVLGALGSVATPDALRLALAQLGTAELANEAGAAVVSIAAKLGEAEKATADDALDEVLKSGASKEVKDSARKASRRLNRQAK